MSGEKAASYDVIITGLGPTGAMLANLLGQYGHNVLCIERDADIYYAPKAVHFDDEIMRIFQSAGLAAEIAATAEPFTEMAFKLSPQGPEVWRTKVGTQDFRYGHAGAWWFHQPTLERQLRTGLSRFPRVELLLGAAVTSLEQDAEQVAVTARLADGTTRALRARFLIGSDGGRSTIRRLAGLKLESADFDEPWVVVDTRTRSGAKHPDLPHIHQQVCDPAQPVTYVPIAGPYYEWQFMVVGGRSEREATDPMLVRSQLRQFVDLDTIEITRIAFYKFHALWAAKWRANRIILAGDSAHQMPPFLGQGMCSGIRDADSLAWRLDAILRGAAGLSLLDDYEAERSAHVQHIIKGAMFLGRVIQTRNKAIAFLRNRLMFDLAALLPPYAKFTMYITNRKRPLERGWIGTLRPRLAGRLMPQPRVRHAGASVLLDELQGQGFAVLARADAAPGIATQLAREALPVGMVCLAVDPPSGGTGIADPSGQIAALLREAKADFIIVRPDHYIFDAGSRAEFPRALTALAARFQPSTNMAQALAA